MKLRGSPSYVGYWVVWRGGKKASQIQTRGAYLNEHSSFRMFIDSRKEIREGREEIEGRTKDKYGRAKIIGEISGEKIRFIKRYEIEHCDMDAIEGDIIFEGFLSPEIYYGRRFYEGNWTAKDRDGKIINAGVFLLEDYNPSRTLEFLMRMDHK